MLSISETAPKTGLSVDTLHYYEKIGLVPNVARHSGGRRRYGATDLSGCALFSGHSVVIFLSTRSVNCSNSAVVVTRPDQRLPG